MLPASQSSIADGKMDAAGPGRAAAYRRAHGADGPGPVGHKDSLPKIVQRLLTFKLQELDVSQTLILLHTYWLCMQQAPEVVAAKKEQVIAQLDAVFPHPSDKWLHVGPIGMGNVQWQLARLLAELGSPTIAEKTCRSLLVSDKQEDRLMGLFVLRNVREGWTPELRRAYFTALNEGSSFVGGEGMPKFLAHLREDALATLTDSEEAALADLLKPAHRPTSRCRRRGRW